MWFSLGISAFFFRIIAFKTGKGLFVIPRFHNYVTKGIISQVQVGKIDLSYYVCSLLWISCTCAYHEATNSGHDHVSCNTKLNVDTFHCHLHNKSHLQINLPSVFNTLNLEQTDGDGPNAEMIVVHSINLHWHGVSHGNPCFVWSGPNIGLGRLRVIVLASSIYSVLSAEWCKSKWKKF